MLSYLVSSNNLKARTRVRANEVLMNAKCAYIVPIRLFNDVIYRRENLELKWGRCDHYISTVIKILRLIYKQKMTGFLCESFKETACSYCNVFWYILTEYGELFLDWKSRVQFPNDRMSQRGKPIFDIGSGNSCWHFGDERPLFD